MNECKPLMRGISNPADGKMSSGLASAFTDKEPKVRQRRLTLSNPRSKRLELSA